MWDTLQEMRNLRDKVTEQSVQNVRDSSSGNSSPSRGMCAATGGACNLLAVTIALSRQSERGAVFIPPSSIC